ncbi:metallopeptidase TldD-related protein [Vitiosangium sp. GDMCC 1.1324]|uniref:metallopeptidase TldD-related protein n=1 Tax=Vitiosangium sp. (strain GDMCC 1.1324) TaxID=2138576 RepID=UPI000D381F97|nr:metallopeptidase TldD-related protein [Vitiosangium sp. GDMCC 1.1324]PTL79245.1 TldD/PmbA family protein [Vitiosangium sp. GDMCC 1.1324]
MMGGVSAESEMPETGADGREVGAAMAPRVLAGWARDALTAFSRRHDVSSSELFLTASRGLTLEYEARTGGLTFNRGDSLSAAARVWQGERSGHAVLPVGAPEDLERVLSLALVRMGPGSAAPPVVAPGLDEDVPPPLPELPAQRMQWLAELLVHTVVPPGVVVQAVVLARTVSWRVLVRGDGTLRFGSDSREEAFVRCETSRGAIVDAVASPVAEDWAITSLRERLAQAVEALEGPAEAVDPGLPLVLRPAVAAPLVAGLAWLLRGDVVASTPALSRAVGKKLFPSVLGVEDDPLHPLGAWRRGSDDEGVPTRRLRLVEEGRLQGFLHSAGTAARLGAEPNGRGLRFESSAPVPSALNLFIVPRGDALPERHTELVARVEMFTTMPRPGTVSLMAGGWEVHEGRRVRRIAPVELNLPVLETFRGLRGVGSDLTFFPTAEGCGTPTLILPPLLGG